MSKNLEERALHSYFNKIALNFYADALVIDCLEITLTQKNAENPKIYTAPGSIQFSLQSGGKLRIVVDTPASTFHSSLAEIISLQIEPGVLVPDHHYYKLSALCVSGYTWENSEVKTNITYYDGAIVIDASFDCLEINSDLDSPDRFINYFFSDNLKIPFNKLRHIKESKGDRDTSVKNIPYKAEGKLPNLELTFEQLDPEKYPDVIRFYAKPDDPSLLSKLHAQRLLDSTRFCTATLLHPTASIIRVSNTTTYRISSHRKPNKGPVGAPIPKDKTADFFELMSCHYTYICTIALEKEATSIIGQLNNLYTLNGVNLDTVALIVCVACEALAKNSVLKPIGAISQQTILEIEKIATTIKTSDAEKSIIARANSAIGGMKSSRAQDKFYALEKSAAITMNEINAWKELRNPAAHGSLEFKPEKFQEELDKIFRVIQLIYKLTFLIINYRGDFTDYGNRGWPVAQYDAPAHKALLYSSNSPPLQPCEKKE
ncbi:hypothetical protein NUH87_03750 [Pseudomonas batumici]|uniref:hypothetical protein n=1 Tax=Pseudomonas batumici TaxID=226910 RepID=UPI0030D61682